MIKKYRKKPIIVEAVQWKIKNYKEIEEFAKDSVSLTRDGLIVETLESDRNARTRHVATKGDWIIKGIKGEFYPCKPDIFKKTYDEVKE